MDSNEPILKAILALIARKTFPPEELVEIIAPKSSSNKQLMAYNLCNGQTSQAEIVAKTKLDKGSLSRSISRWIEEGIVIRTTEDLPLHIYPLPKAFLK